MVTRFPRPGQGPCAFGSNRFRIPNHFRCVQVEAAEEYKPIDVILISGGGSTLFHEQIKIIRRRANEPETDGNSRTSVKTDGL